MMMISGWKNFRKYLFFFILKSLFLKKKRIVVHIVKILFSVSFFFEDFCRLNWRKTNDKWFEMFSEIKKWNVVFQNDRKTNIIFCFLLLKYGKRFIYFSFLFPSIHPQYSGTHLEHVEIVFFSVSYMAKWNVKERKNEFFFEICEKWMQWISYHHCNPIHSSIKTKKKCNSYPKISFYVCIFILQN